MFKSMQLTLQIVSPFRQDPGEVPEVSVVIVVWTRVMVGLNEGADAISFEPVMLERRDVEPENVRQQNIKAVTINLREYDVKQIGRASCRERV
jgi:hypothetical protein